MALPRKTEETTKVSRPPTKVSKILQAFKGKHQEASEPNPRKTAGQCHGGRKWDMKKRIQEKENPMYNPYERWQPRTKQG